MAKPVVNQGEIRIVLEVDPKTKTPHTKSYRIVYTDAVEENASVPDENALASAIETTIEQTKDQDIDGCIFEPLPIKSEV